MINIYANKQKDGSFKVYEDGIFVKNLNNIIEVKADRNISGYWDKGHWNAIYRMKNDMNAIVKNLNEYYNIDTFEVIEYNKIKFSFDFMRLEIIKKLFVENREGNKVLHRVYIDDNFNICIDIFKDDITFNNLYSIYDSINLLINEYIYKIEKGDRSWIDAIKRL